MAHNGDGRTTGTQRDFVSRSGARVNRDRSDRVPRSPPSRFRPARPPGLRSVGVAGSGGRRESGLIRPARSSLAGGSAPGHGPLDAPPSPTPGRTGPMPSPPPRSRLPDRPGPVPATGKIARQIGAPTRNRTPQSSTPSAHHRALRHGFSAAKLACIIACYFPQTPFCSRSFSFPPTNRMVQVCRTLNAPISKSRKNSPQVQVVPGEKILHRISKKYHPFGTARGKMSGSGGLRGRFVRSMCGAGRGDSGLFTVFWGLFTVFWCQWRRKVEASSRSPPWEAGCQEGEARPIRPNPACDPIVNRSRRVPFSWHGLPAVSAKPTGKMPVPHRSTAVIGHPGTAG